VLGGLRGLTPRIRSHFTKTLISRKKDLSSKKISKKVAKYVLDCFRTGRSLKQERVPPNSLEELLIKLQAAEVAFEQAIDYLDDIGDMCEWLFIVGDYGSGKTQLKFQIQAAAVNRASGFLVVASANLQEASIEGFCEKFVKKLKQLIS